MEFVYKTFIFIMTRSGRVCMDPFKFQGLPKKKKSSAVLPQQKKENYVVIQPGDFREDLGKFHKSSNVR